jgi:carboxyl-terminal processing protease
MKGFLRFLGIVSLIAVSLIVGLAGGVVLGRQLLAQPVLTATVAAPTTPTVTVADPADTESGFQLMREAWDHIQESYVDRPAVDDQRLAYGAISGMVDALGDTGHSRFLSPEMVQEQHDFTSGEFEGIGAYVEMKDGRLVIVAPMDGTPAQQANLRPGDVVLQVDGETVAGLPIDQVIGRILGPAGTQVTLNILTPDSGQTRDVTLIRARITLHNVVWQQVPGTTVAHLRIVAFSKGVTDDLKRALAEIQQQGLTGMVLDLRSNPGGLLDEAIGVASQFLASGNVLLEQDAQGNVTPLPVKDGGLALDTPLIVLVNQGTASAAEIVSGALQDAGRARLVGETTFGTGTVLNEFSLSDGSALLLATEEWLTPNGRLIWHQGINPDEVVTLPVGTAPLLPEAESGMTPEQIQSSGDAQLLRALELLPGAASGGSEAAPQTVTLDNEGQTITVKVGERFLLKLGEEYDWTVTVADQTVLSRVKNVMVVRGAQGLYEATKAGSTTLTASGDPVCRQSQPPCATPSRMFEITAKVP